MLLKGADNVHDAADGVSESALSTTRRTKLRSPESVPTQFRNEVQCDAAQPDKGDQAD